MTTIEDILASNPFTDMYVVYSPVTGKVRGIFVDFDEAVARLEVILARGRGATIAVHHGW